MLRVAWAVANVPLCLALTGFCCCRPQANGACKGPADDDAARLLAAARHECEQLRSELATLRLETAVGISVPCAGSHRGSGEQERQAVWVCKLDACLSVPVICVLQGLCIAGLIALHAGLVP
jgi:hypothetical protein